jgi:CRISPR-associated protein Csd1
MLLTALKAFSDANNETVLPDFYDLQEVRYRVDLDREGNLLSFVPMNDPANPKRGQRLPIPYIKRTSSIIPLIIDKGDYLLGVSPTKKDDDERAKAAIRTPKAHSAYLDLLAEAVATTQAEPLRALERFARSFVAVDDDPRLPDGYDAAAFVAVYVDGLLVSEDARIQKWWADRQTASGANRASRYGGASAAGPYDEICGICGRPGVSVEVIPIGIRGFGSLGGSATMALISGNDEAFVRHGMPRASGAGVCIDCGRATHQALNRLIGDPKHCKRLGTTLTVWWATEECEDLLAAVLEGNTDGAVGEVLSSITSGRLRRPVDASRFYGVSLGASKSRIVVQSWIDTTLGEAQDHVRSWFQRVRVVDKWDGSMADPPGLFRLLASLAPPGHGDALSRIDPSLPTCLLETVLAGRALPRAVLAQVLGRIRAEQGAVTPLRAALLKACLVSPDYPNLEEHMTGLDPDNTDPPYLCGRLLAMLDQASRLATSANNALVDRSYASASTMPAVTFTRLLRLHRSHLDKLKRDNPGAAYRIDGTITEIMNGFSGTSGLPAHLGMAEQARFALGLYHQEAASRASAQAAKAARVVSGQPSDRELEPIINENEE